MPKNQTYEAKLQDDLQFLRELQETLVKAFEEGDWESREHAKTMVADWIHELESIAQARLLRRRA